jgi:AcrR family transcriptional regulator
MASKKTKASNGDMREHLLRTAEKLFAARGVTNVSLREVSRKANANTALLHYHFGSKLKFYGALVQRCLKPVNDERLRLLGECETRSSAKSPPKLEEVIHAWVAPTLMRESATGEPALLIRLYGDIVAQTDPVFRKAQIPYSKETVRRFVSAFERALPDLDPLEVHLRFYYLVGIVRSVCTDPVLLEQLTDGKISFSNLNRLVEQIVASTATILAAPARVRLAIEP